MLETKKIILFADNDTEFLQTRAEYMEKAGYQVLKAFSLVEARKLMVEAHFHIAILDIRLEDDDDEKDVSGLTLAKSPTSHSIPKLILTNFPSAEAVKEALRPALQGLPPAVDFIFKRDGPQVMLETIARTFTEFVPINWQVRFQGDPQEGLSFPHLASLLDKGLSNGLLVHRAGELEDLLRQLFFDYEQVRFGRMFWREARRFCLPVLAHSTAGVNDSYILVCGEDDVLRREQEQVKNLSPDSSQETRLYKCARTVHFGANLYKLPVALEAVQTLRDLLRQGKERPLKAAFGNLLGEVLQAWHQRGEEVRANSDLMSLYRNLAGLAEDQFPRQDVEICFDNLVQMARGLEAVEIERSNARLGFNIPHQSGLRFPDPMVNLYASTSPRMPVVSRISPGGLTLENILVDAAQHTCLTDFACSGLAPQWWDFVCLEAAIRFDLAQGIDLTDRLEFEKCLAEGRRLDARLDQEKVASELRIHLDLIEQVRRQAANECGPSASPYNAGLLTWVIKAMTRYEPDALYTLPDRLRATHLLLAAGNLSRSLGMSPTQPQPGGTLRLDEDGRVWIGKRLQVELNGQRLKLFRCLYDRPGRLMSNREIVEGAYGEIYDEKDPGRDQRIRTEIRRLREEIEPDPGRPRYILNARDKGYRLQVEGKEETLA